MNDLVPDESINVTLADAINNAGQIAASGDDGVGGAALLLTPIRSCVGDIDCDGFVGITDFLDLLAAWGPQPNHPADLDGDGVVGIVDFLMLLGNWGPCPQPCPPACPADLDGDCSVGITDFQTLLENWG